PAGQAAPDLPLAASSSIFTTWKVRPSSAVEISAMKQTLPAGAPYSWGTHGLVCPAPASQTEPGQPPRPGPTFQRRTRSSPRPPRPAAPASGNPQTLRWLSLPLRPGGDG